MKNRTQKRFRAKYLRCKSKRCQSKKLTRGGGGVESKFLDAVNTTIAIVVHLESEFEEYLNRIKEAKDEEEKNKIKAAYQKVLDGRAEANAIAKEEWERSINAAKSASKSAPKSVYPNIKQGPFSRKNDKK